MPEAAGMDQALELVPMGTSAGPSLQPQAYTLFRFGTPRYRIM